MRRASLPAIAGGAQPARNLKRGMDRLVDDELVTEVEDRLRVSFSVSLTIYIDFITLESHTIAPTAIFQAAVAIAEATP